MAIGRIAGRFARVEPRLWAGRLVLGLLSDLPRKNYVLAVAFSAEVATKAGKFCADALAAKLPKRAWQKLFDLADPAPGYRLLLIRRNGTTGELAYYRCHSTLPVPLSTLVKTAGSRWQVEKGLAGLDEHQVRRYPSWSRWVTLAMLAHA